MKEVIIKIQSVQGYDREEEESLDFITDGYYSFDGRVGRLSYMESEVTGLPGTRTSMEILPDEIIIDREGFVTSRMVFKEGVKNSFQYNTPYGFATMGMDTRKVKHSFNERGGHAEIDYVLDMEHAVALRNKFRINVREQIGDNIHG